MPVGQQAVAEGQAAAVQEAERVESAHTPLPGDGEPAKPAAAAAANASVSNIAWAIVALAFFSDALAMGGRCFFAVVLPLWEVEFGWSRSYVSGAMSFVHVFQGLATPFAGHLVDVLGPRGGLTAGLLYLAAVLALTATVEQSWQLFLIFGTGLGISFGLLNLNVYSAMIMQIVPPSRAGTAVGIATSGSTFGQFALVPLFQHLAEIYGWRTGYVLAGVATACIAPLAWILLTISRQWTEATATAVSKSSSEGAAADGVDTDTFKAKIARLLTNKLYWALT